jgi:peptide/nickel transport system permease protein
LLTLYAAALFADFLSPYAFDGESRRHSYAPPGRVHWVGADGRLTRPFVHDVSFSFDENHKRVYGEDRTTAYPVRFFSEGDPYKFLGFIPAKIHLFGVEAPARIYLLGADARGRDLLSRLLYGGRVSLSIGLIGVSISFTLGLLIGGISGYYGGWVDNLIMRLTEMFMLIPGFYLMLALISAMPDHFNSVQIYLTLVVVLSLIGWAGLARIIRGLAISLREREYVLAAKALGLTDLQIIRRHILPHTFSYSIVAATLSVPGYIMGEAALSLLGLGIQDPVPSWGNLLSDAMAIAHIQSHPWILAPGALIFITVICFNVSGDALRDAFDPLLKKEEL